MDHLIFNVSYCIIIKYKTFYNLKTLARQRDKMNIFPRFLLSIVIGSIIYPVTILHAGKSLKQNLNKTYRRTYGMQKSPLQTREQRAQIKLATEQRRTVWQAQYDAGLAIAKLRLINSANSVTLSNDIKCEVIDLTK